MKKTIITLFALAGVAMADSYTKLADVTTVTDANKSASITGNTSLSATVALTLNVQAFGKDLGQSTGNGTNHFIVTLGGTWEDGAVGKLATVAYGGTADDNTTYNGLQGYWAKGDNDSLHGNADMGMNNAFSASPINWNNVKAASLVMTYREPANHESTTINNFIPWAFAFSYSDLNGRVTTLGGEKNNLLRFNNINTFTVTDLLVDSSYVTAYTLYADGMDLNAAKALSAARVVPEPATATLSLLALAGLAVRRRRK